MWSDEYTHQEGNRYFIIFIDDYSRICVIYLFSKKSDSYEKLREYISIVKNKFGKFPSAIRSDNGGEYVNSELEDYHKHNGIKYSSPYHIAQIKMGLVRENIGRYYIWLKIC